MSETPDSIISYHRASLILDSSQRGAEITSLAGQLGDVGSVTRGRGQDIQVPIWVLNRNQSSRHTLEKESCKVL